MTGKELIAYFNAPNPTAKAKAMATKLKRNVFIGETHKVEFLFVLQENGTYKRELLNRDTLYPKITSYLSQSYDAMDKQSLDELYQQFEKRKDMAKFVSYNLSNYCIDAYKPQLYSELKRKDVKPDSDTMQIHYNNGYIDLKTGQFCQRDPMKQVVTFCINRDYKHSTKQERAKIREYLLKIYPLEDLRCIEYNLGRSFTKDDIINNDVKPTTFLIGQGCTGKSFSMRLTQEALGGDEGYVFQIQSDVFEIGNQNRNKILNSFLDKGYVRICWVNEFSDKRVASDQFKNFCDGKIQTIRLYSDGTCTININCSVWGTMNHIPNIDLSDSGNARRIITYEHKIQFTSDKTKVDEKNGIYLEDKKLLSNIIRTGLLDAWVDIIAETCVKIHNDDYKSELTKNFIEAKETVTTANDAIQDFIDSTLKLTKNDGDRIGRKAMKALFDEANPKRFISMPQLIMSLKDKGIRYEPKYRHDNMQGCFVGVKKQTPNESYMMEEADLDHGIEKVEMAVDIEKEGMKKEIAQLKQLLEEKRKENDNLHAILLSNLLRNVLEKSEPRPVVITLNKKQPKKERKQGIDLTAMDEPEPEPEPKPSEIQFGNGKINPKPKIAKYPKNFTKKIYDPEEEQEITY